MNRLEYRYEWIRNQLWDSMGCVANLPHFQRTRKLNLASVNPSVPFFFIKRYHSSSQKVNLYRKLFLILFNHAVGMQKYGKDYKFSDGFFRFIQYICDAPAQISLKFNLQVVDICSHNTLKAFQRSFAGKSSEYPFPGIIHANTSKAAHNIAFLSKKLARTCADVRMTSSNVEKIATSWSTVFLKYPGQIWWV